MLKTTLHCDGCVRTQPPGEPGWFVVTEVIEARVLDPEGAKLAVDRALIIRDVKVGELPTQGHAYCGVECLTKAVHAFTDRVLREQAARRAA